MKTKCNSRLTALGAAVILLSYACLNAMAQEYRVLYHFAGGTNDGGWPLLGRLIQSGSTLYGMTSGGGSNNLGTVFKLNTDGTGYQILHSFVSAGSDGSRPYGSLLQSGSTLYGMSSSEGATNRGTVFKLNTDGTGFQVLHTFSTNEGKWPYDSLIQDGTNLYGMCTYGGSSTGDDWVGNGTIFKIDTNGAAFTRLRAFSGSSSSTGGGGPHGSLIQSGTTLYGTTLWGGSSGLGGIFKIQTNGTGYSLFYSFTGGTTGGGEPYGTTLVQSGPILYGMTKSGGSSNGGTIFKVNTNGTGFPLLHSFAGGAGDGWQPFCGTLVQSGSMLYGMTTGGGAGGGGTVFQINTNGTGFRVLHEFETSTGQGPWGSLLLYGSTLYGMTQGGGSNSVGVIFALDLPLPQLAMSIDDTNVNLSWSTNFPDFALESVGRLGEAWTPVPGVTGYSATLPVNPATNQFFRLKK
jgi:uncharacterized repeat protein (TIGR03803 family)